MEVNQVAEAGEKQFEARKEKSEKEEKERLAKFREELKKKPSFYSEKVMNTRIYGKETTKSEDPKSSSKQVNKEKSSSSRKERSPSSGKRVGRDQAHQAQMTRKRGWVPIRRHMANGHIVYQKLNKSYEAHQL